MLKTLLCFLTVCFLASSALSARTVTYYPGIYSLGATDMYLSPANYDSSYVTGGAIRVSWANLEPAEGAYDWSYLDHEIATARSRGKHISIFFGGAFKSPAWLLSSPSIHFFMFQDGSQVVKTPLPYDSVYLSKLCRFITAFGARYRDTATIAYVRGASESVTQGWGLPGTDTAGRTLAGYYHYTTDTLLHAMERVLDTFMAAFPYTPEWVEVGKLPFDTLGGHHNIYTGEEIAAYGFARYPDRFNVWREDFNACFPVPPDTLSMPNPYHNSYWHILYDHPCHNGAQAVWNLLDVSCTNLPRMDMCDPAQCSKDTVLWRAVSRTLRYGMTYLEIYAADIGDPTLHRTLRKTADSLLAKAGVCFGGGLGIPGQAATGGELFRWDIYPNPASGELHFTLSHAAGEQLLFEIRDVSGSLVKTITAPQQPSFRADVSDLRPGLYIISLTRNGCTTDIRKITIVK